MGSTFGETLRVTVFGQSHSDAIGCVVEGLPAGFKPDLDALAAFMARRAPGRDPWSTPRREADAVRIVSGLNDRGETCGAPLATLIENTSHKSSDYDLLARVPRPGHADLTALARWDGHQDVRGGGHFSGRLTAPVCAAGGIALQLLSTQGVRIGAHLLQVADVTDEPLAALDLDDASQARLAEQLDALADGRTFPCILGESGITMAEAIAAAREVGDSVGGIVECVACGMPMGVGGPMFDGIESAIARVAFGIPAVKGIEFGAGFTAALMRGSEHNDPYAPSNADLPQPTKNDAGGNLGGITTGAPVLFRMAVKPTSSIAQPQDSVDLTTGEQVTLEVPGRHDPCIAPRAVPVAEAIMALALLDSWLTYPPHASVSGMGW